MRNLKLLYEQIADIELACSYFTIDNETGKFYIACDFLVIGCNSKNFAKEFELNLLDTNLGFAIDIDVQVVGLQYLCGEEQICIALQHGDIMLCGTTDRNVECVGTLDCKINSMLWSPDQEVVLFVTNRGSVVAMNHDFDPITELEITSDLFGKEDFVNVGWGSKETQFQGSKESLFQRRTKKRSLLMLSMMIAKLKLFGAVMASILLLAMSKIHQENFECGIVHVNYCIQVRLCLVWKVVLLGNHLVH